MRSRVVLAIVGAAAVVAAAAVPFLLSSDARAAGPVEGKPAPDFKAPASDGRTVSLSDFRGKTVVLYFYPKDDTPGCTVEAKSFRDAAGELKRLNVVVLGVSQDDLASHLEFAKKYDLNFPLVSDEGGKIHDLYGAWKGNVFGRTAMGVDRSTFVIDKDGVLRKTWRSVNPAGHTDEVLGYIRTL